MRRLAFILLVLAALLAAVAIPSAPAATKAKQTCIVHRYNAAGKKVVFRVSVYRYKKVRRHGHRVRIIVTRKVALRASCTPTRACVKTKLSGGKVIAVYARRRVLTRVRRGNLLVMRRISTKVPVLGRCVKPSASPDADLGVPIRITILPGSRVHLDFGAFQRDTLIAGSIRGYSPELKIDITRDIPVVLTDGTINLGVTPIYIDADCGGRETASVRTGKSAVAVLDGSKDSNGILTTSGAVTASTYLQVRLPLELRDGETGCDKPYIDTQYASWPLHITLAGRIDPKTGLTKLHLSSAPVLARDLEICLNPGLQTEPCTGYAIPLPINISTDVFVKVDLNPK